VEPVSLSAFKGSDFIKQFDAFVFSDYDKGFLDESSISEIVRMIKKVPGDSIIFVDSKKKNLLPYGDAIIKINKREHSGLIEHAGGAELVITMGAEGAEWGGHIYPAFKTEVYDVCGAGDTFLAALVFQYLRGDGAMNDAIMFANLCSATTIKKIGAHAIQLDEVSAVWKDCCESMGN
jgi:bifunctional ADP-heptose synthase (sugar kinase/adenylyltransferase)